MSHNPDSNSEQSQDRQSDSYSESGSRSQGVMPQKSAIVLDRRCQDDILAEI